MQIKMTMNVHHKKSKWKGCGEKKTFICCWWKYIQKLFKNINITKRFTLTLLEMKQKNFFFLRKTSLLDYFIGKDKYETITLCFIFCMNEHNHQNNIYLYIYINFLKLFIIYFTWLCKVLVAACGISSFVEACRIFSWSTWNLDTWPVIEH